MSLTIWCVIFICDSHLYRILCETVSRYIKFIRSLCRSVYHLHCWIIFSQFKPLERSPITRIYFYIKWKLCLTVYRLINKCNGVFVCIWSFINHKFFLVCQMVCKRFGSNVLFILTSTLVRFNHTPVISKILWFYILYLIHGTLSISNIFKCIFPAV